MTTRTTPGGHAIAHVRLSDGDLGLDPDLDLDLDLQHVLDAGLARGPDLCNIETQFHLEDVSSGANEVARTREAGILDHPQQRVVQEGPDHRQLGPAPLKKEKQGVTITPGEKSEEDRSKGEMESPVGSLSWISSASSYNKTLVVAG